MKYLSRHSLSRKLAAVQQAGWRLEKAQTSAHGRNRSCSTTTLMRALPKAKVSRFSLLSPGKVDLSFMSAIYFAQQQICFSHKGQEHLLPCFTGSMLLHTADGWQIRLKSISHSSQETLFTRVDAEVEAHMSIPLEQHDVPRVRAWLTAHEVFNFQAAEGLEG